MSAKSVGVVSVIVFGEMALENGVSGRWNMWKMGSENGVSVRSVRHARCLPSRRDRM